MKILETSDCTDENGRNISAIYDKEALYQNLKILS